MIFKATPAPAINYRKIMELAESDIRHIFLDAEGRQHFLCKGDAAARMIANGQTPELHFEDCKEMHRHLDDLGIFNNSTSHGRLARSTVQYMVYQSALNKSNDPDLKYRVFTTWPSDSHTPFSKELKGWGDRKQDDPSMVFERSDGADGVNKLFRSFRVEVKTPIFLDQKITMDNSMLQDVARVLKEQGLLPKNVDFVGDALAEPDAIYKGTGNLYVVMQIDGVDESHANLIGRSSCKPFMDKLAHLMGIQRRAAVSAMVRVMPHMETGADIDEAQADSDLSPSPPTV